MHDIKAIREDPASYDRAWGSKGLPPQTEAILELDARVRSLQTELQRRQAERNELSKRIGQAKAQKNEAEAAKLMADVEFLKSDPDMAEAELVSTHEELNEVLASLPNLPADEVPLGEDEHGNVEVRRWGEPFAIASPKDHVDLGEALGLMEFEAAARMSGSRFVVLKGQLARLERALGQFMIDIQTREHGYLEVSPPLIVKSDAMFGTGQLPKFSNDLFRIPYFDDVREAGEALTQAILQTNISDIYPPGDPRNAVTKQQTQERAAQLFKHKLAEYEAGNSPDNRWLIPTAEVSLTNLVREQITAEEELPLRLTALTPSFRSEAGASGRDTRGMIRQHQFYKVELVSITTPEQSADEHERMVGCAESILKRLDLPFRTMLLCTGDMGFGARKTYDLEVWLPSQATYREISSCSNCGDFQARRMDARSRKTGEKGTRFLHTLNGSGLAVGRTLVALMENYQDEGGRIAIPQVLQSYMGGLTHIGGKA